jgi:hypothetical protein
MLEFLRPKRTVKPLLTRENVPAETLLMPLSTPLNNRMMKTPKAKPRL